MRARTVSDLEAVLYSLYVNITPLSRDEFNHIARRIRYFCEKDGMSWLACYSTTDSKTAKQDSIKTGKRGRPRKSVTGVKIDGHVHACVKGTNEKSAYSTAQKIKKDLDLHYWKKICTVESKGPCTGAHAKNTISYNFGQSDITRSGGDFDFMEYAKEN